MREKSNKIDEAAALFGRFLEPAAVVANLLFTLLYLNQSSWSFVFGVLGPLFSLALSWRERLYAEPVLQVVYLISAVIGWFNVQEGWNMKSLELGLHFLLFAGSVLIAIIWGAFLKRQTRANYPYTDAFLSSWGMLATWLMMFGIEVCWLYLMVVNVLSFFIYFRRRLFLAACMFVLYFFMSLDGYFQFHWFEL